MSQKKKNPVATVCSLLGTILLIVLILGCIPLTVPKAFGYNIYTVISGSMEPAIPVGSLVYVKYQEPETIQKKDVIAFYGAKDASSIVTHRVVTNKKLSGEFITKGDANQTKDMNPVNYNNYMGKVVLSIPVIGGIAQSLTTGSGKIALFCLIAFILLLEILGSLLHKVEFKKIDVSFRSPLSWAFFWTIRPLKGGK